MIVFLDSLLLPGVGIYLPACRIAEAGSIYSFIDSQGVWHFTNVPSDPRFTKIEITETSATLHSAPVAALRTRPNKIDGFLPIINQAANSFGLDPDLIKAVIRAESGGDPAAISPKGAMGLMQLMPKTAGELMIYNPFDPAENIRAGSRYLGWLLKMYDGDIINALAAYNAGIGAVNRYGGLPPYAETVNYVRRVLDFWKKSKGIVSP